MQLIRNPINIPVYVSAQMTRFYTNIYMNCSTEINEVALYIYQYI